MTIKRKIAVTTLAASLVTGSLAALPFSDKGLAEQVGLVNVASAATSYDDFMTRLDSIHDALIAGGDAQDVRDLRTEIMQLNYASNNSAIDPLWTYVPAAVKNDTNVDFKQVLFDTFQALGSIMYSTRSDEIDAIRANPQLQAALVELAAVTSTDKLTVNDLLAFTDAIEAEAVNQVSTNLTSLLLNHSSSFVTSLVKESVKNVLANNSTLEVSKVLSWLKDTANVSSDQLSTGLADTYANFTTALPSGTDATQALMIAFIRAEAVSSVSASNSGRTKTYSLSLDNITIPSSLLTWTKVSGSADITEGTSGAFILASSATTGTAEIQATLLGKVVYSGSVSFSISSGGGGVVVPPTPSVKDQLKDLKDKISKATGEEKAKLIQEAVSKAVDAIKDLSSVPMKKEAVNGGTKFTVDDDALAKQFAQIQELIDALKDSAPGAELPSTNLQLTVPESSDTYVSCVFKANSVSKAIALGFKGITFNVLGFKANYPFNALTAVYNTATPKANRVVNFAARSAFDATPVATSAEADIDFTVKKSEATADVLGDKKAASDVYEISLAVGGKAVDLAGKPVDLSFPLNDTTGLDKELLTVAKITDGKLSIEGGVVDGATIIEKRDTLGTFVVIENKVSFNDISKVKAWAGRQIEVLAAKGAVQGRKAGAFEPNGQVTRAEFAKMLIHALDLDKTAVTGKFTDVLPTDWFAPYVAAAVEAGIINGRTATTFVPNATITRAEMAAMVARALQTTKGAKADAEDLKALEAFKDAGDISASLKEGVAFAANNDLVVGDKGKFNPNATATRAQAGVIIYRAFNFKG